MSMCIPTSAFGLIFYTAFTVYDIDTTDNRASQDSHSVHERAESGVDHGLWDGVLRRHVSDTGLVDYAGLQQSKDFRSYLRLLTSTSADALTNNNERLAFWINAYNALTVDAILQTLPKDRSKWNEYRITEQKIRGKSLWKGLPFQVGGGSWTLDGIEHEILRKEDGLRDPRIHVALVCAARGCPPLWNRAYLGSAIKDQLDAAMSRFVGNPTQCSIDVQRRKITISKVFKWYGGDFVDRRFSPRAKTVAKFLAPFASDPAVGEALLEGSWKMRYFDYDWRLNVQR